MMGPFAFLCALLSPLTSEEGIRQLSLLARRGKVDWEAVAKYANRAGLASALRQALENKRISTDVPPTFRNYVEEIYEFNVRRNEGLLLQLQEIARVLNAVEVTPLLLKGGAALATNLFPDPGMRFMWDLDLLVPEGTLEKSVEAMKGVGYVVPEKFTNGPSSHIDWAAKHHHAPLIRPGAPASVELHRRVLSVGESLLEVDAVWRESRPLTGNRLPGVAVAVMSPTDELIYCFAHAEVGHRHNRFTNLDARQLHHFTYFFDRYRNQIDWARVEILRDSPLFGQRFKDYQCLANMLFNVQLPVSSGGETDETRSFCRALLTNNALLRQMNLVRMFVFEMVWIFSRDRLRMVYPQKGLSISRLRFRHLLFLLGRYRRMESWRRRLRGLNPL